MSRYSLPCYPTFDGAEALASLAGIRDDLRQVLSYCESVEEQVRTMYHVPVTWDGMTTAAVVAYARCFNGGARKYPYQKLIVHFSADMLDAHNYFRALRDKHVAHSVNTYEENLLVVTVEMDGSVPQGVESVDISSRRVVGVGEQDLGRLRALAQSVLTAADRLYEVEQGLVLEQLRMLPLEPMVAERGEPLPAFLLEQSITDKRRKP
jgi:hypothetical protein